MTERPEPTFFDVSCVGCGSDTFAESADARVYCARCRFEEIPGAEPLVGTERVLVAIALFELDYAATIVKIERMDVIIQGVGGVAEQEERDGGLVQR